MNIFAIIVIYNGMYKNWIEKCFSSLRNSDHPLQIIAIDNNSSDESVNYIEQNFPEVELIKSNKNLGFGGANNLGIKSALEKNADAAFLLNQDAWIENKTISELIRISKDNQDYGIISPLQLDGTGERLEWAFSNSIGYDYNKDFFSDYILNKPKKELYETTESYAASWFITKKCLELIGGFSPSFFHYAEDDNYRHRVLFKKMKIGVTPKTFICHDTYDKPKNKFQDLFEKEKRILILSLSNPNSKEISKNRILLRFFVKLLKSFLNFNLNGVKNNYKLYLFFRKNYDVIISNKKKSMSDEKFCFVYL